MLGFHNIREGHVGVYWRWGKLQSRLEPPGYHHMLPLGIDEVLEVSVTLETTVMHGVPCGTSGGVLLHFDEVEVVYRLQPQDVVDTVKNYSGGFVQTWIRDPLPSLMNEVCNSLSLHDVHIGRFAELDDMMREKLSELLAEWAPGLQVITVRLVKPTIPSSVQQNFDEVADFSSKLKTVTAHQTVVLRAAEKDRSLAVLGAQKELEVARMHANSSVLAAERSVGINEVKLQTAEARMREQADAESYAKQREAEANKHKLTKIFLDLQRRVHLMRNIELNIGPAVPAAIVDVDDDHEEEDGSQGALDLDDTVISMSAFRSQSGLLQQTTEPAVTP